MSDEIELVSDGDGLAIIGNETDVQRFLLDQGLDRCPSRSLDLHRLESAVIKGGSLVQAGSELAANSGRWVRLTKDSAAAVRRWGLMPSKKGGIGHAMIGPRPGHSQQWLQIDKVGGLLCGPVAPVVLATLMQQQAMQAQMDEIVEYLQEINEKVDDILRGQKDAVLADMIGVDLIIEDAWTVRNQTGRVSEITWSKVQGTSMTIASTQAYALRQLDAISEKLHSKKDPAELSKAAKDAEVKVREWLAVLARCFQLQDQIIVLELDRVLDASPEELDQHRIGLITARQNRRELIARGTQRLLVEMGETVDKANSKVLFNPFKSPAVVRSSNQVTADLLNFRGRLGIQSDSRSFEAKGWGKAALEARDELVTTTVEGFDATRQYCGETFEQASEAFRWVDIDGDGIPDKPRALVAAEDAGSAIKGAASDAAEAIGSGANEAGVAIGGLATGAASAVGSLFQRKQANDASSDDLEPESAE